MKIILIILFGFVNCFSKELKTFHSKTNNTGTIILEFEDIEKGYLNSVQFRLTSEKPNVRQELTLEVVNFFELPLIIPYMIDVGNVIPSETEYFANGYLKNNKKYIFKLEEGVYYASLGNNFNDKSSEDSKYSKRLNLSQIGFLTNFMNEYITDCRKAEFKDLATKYVSSIDECGILKIKKNEVIKIKIIGNPKKIDYPSTLLTWFPGIFILMPIWWGTEGYYQSYNVLVIRN